MSDSVQVAIGGTIERQDWCHECMGPMLYRYVDGRVVGSFCQNIVCPLWLKESR
jgi:hypothetical protein